MIDRRRLRIGAPAAVVLLLLTSALLVAVSAPRAFAAGPAARAYALSGSNLLAFDPARPTTVLTTPITGVAAGESLVGIDVRPQNGMLYALGVNSTADTATLYALSPETGVAGVVGTSGQISFTTNGITQLDLPDPAVVGYGFDFNPMADRIRVTSSSGLNFRVNPSNGAGVDGDNGGAAGSVTGVNPDGSRLATVSATAYTSSRPDVTATTLYTLDAAANELAIQNPPNAGTQTEQKTVTLGGSPLDFTDANGFDIDPTVDAGAAGAVGYAALTVGGTTGLYTIDLASGAAIALGTIGTGSIAVQGLALQRDAADAGYPLVALSGANVARMRSATPAEVTYAGLGPTVAGEEVVALTWRPQTGQLYGLGVDAAANTGTLYLIDPQTGAVAAVGATRQIAFVDAGGAAVDFPPATSGWGISFNPTVDRLRVVADGGIDFRVNPASGAPIDGNLNAGSPAGTNMDGPHRGFDAGATGVTATAYTNGYGQLLTGGATTQYVLEPTANKLYLQVPPNAGTLIDGRVVTAAGAPLDFGPRASFGLPAGVRVTTSNTAATGSGIALLQVGNVNGVYRLDLATAAAIFLGQVASPLTSVAVGQAWGTPRDPAPGPGPGDPGPGGPGAGGQGPGGGPGGPGGGTTPPRDTVKPRLSRVTVTAARRRRLTLAFGVSEAGTATVRVVRTQPGRRSGRACSPRARRGKRCTVRTTIGTVTRVVRAGRARLVIAGRVGRRALPLGAVRIELSVRDKAGNRSATIIRGVRVKR